MTSSAALPPVPGAAGAPGCGGGGPVAALQTAEAYVEEAAATLWAARSGDELTATVAVVARLRAKLDALELAVVSEIDAGPVGQQSLKDAGWASTKDFLTHTTGGRRGAGPATVRLAEQLDRYPTIAEAMTTGRLSRVKAQIVAAALDRLPADRALRDEAVTVMLEHAQALSADDLDRAGRHLLAVVDPEGTEAAQERDLARSERAAHHHRALTIRFDRLGGGHGELHGSAEDVALLKTVLMSLAAPQPADPGSCGGDQACTDHACRVGGHSGRDPRDHGARMFDALVRLARTAQAAGTLPDSHGGIPQVVVTMDYDGLRERTGAATTTLGEDLDAGTVRRMACDADVIPSVLGRDGAVLDVGRTQRLVTAALWTALVVRDRHCAFPGCRRPPVMCHAHHVIHWVDGGATSLDNMVLLCGAHHRIVHTTPWEVRMNSGDRRPEFKPPDRDAWVRDRPPDP